MGTTGGAIASSFFSRCSVLAQLSFGRTVRIPLKRAGTYSSTSETSSPSGRSVPPQSGQACCFGAIVSTSRGSSAGSRRRAGFFAGFSCTATIASCAGSGSAAA